MKYRTLRRPAGKATNHDSWLLNGSDEKEQVCSICVDQNQSVCNHTYKEIEDFKGAVSND